MDAIKISVKLFVETDDFAPSEFVPVFHRWIQDGVLEDHLTIDVADYAHVPAGPGSLLVANEANVHMDRTENRLGLLYFRKTSTGDTFADRLRAVLGYTLKAANNMEQEPQVAGRLIFRTNELQIRLNDRLAAPNTPATFAAVKPDVEKVLGEVYGAGKVTVEHVNVPNQVFTLKVTSTTSPSVSDLLAKVAPVNT